MLESTGTIFLFGLPGGPELIIILVIVLLLFGGKKLPEVARGLGKGIREFKKAKDGLNDAIKSEVDELEKKEAAAKEKAEDTTKDA